MNLLSVLFLIYCGATTAYEITKFGNVGYELQQVEFDSDLNTYIRTLIYEGASNFYKLDDQKNYLVLKGYYWIEKLIVNSRNDCYVDVYPGTVGLHQLHLLRANSTEVEYLFTFPHTDEPFHNMFFVDELDIAYFNTGDGVVLLRPDENIPLVVKNLEGFIFDKYDVDKSGNVYLVNSQRSSKSLAVIEKDGKTSRAPFGKYILTDIKITDLKSWIGTELVLTRSSDAIATISIEVGLVGAIELLSKYRVDYHFVNVTTQDRLFILENSTIIDEVRLLFITPTLEIVYVENILNSSIFKINTTIVAADSEGTAYFVYGDRQILRLKFDETAFSRIDVSTKKVIFDLAVDGDDNLWILTEELYVLEKGTDTPVKVSTVDTHLETNVSSFLKYKFESRELYIGTMNGLYLCTKDKVNITLI